MKPLPRFIWTKWDIKDFVIDSVVIGTDKFHLNQVGYKEENYWQITNCKKAVSSEPSGI